MRVLQQNVPTWSTQCGYYFQGILKLRSRPPTFLHPKIYRPILSIIHLTYILWGGGGWVVSYCHDKHISSGLIMCYFTKHGIVISGFSSVMKEPNGINLVNFEQIMVKSNSFEQKWWWVGNFTHNWYREVKIFEIWKVHKHTIWEKVPPPWFYLCDTRSTSTGTSNWHLFGIVSRWLTYVDAARFISSDLAWNFAPITFWHPCYI